MRVGFLFSVHKFNRSWMVITLHFCSIVSLTLTAFNLFFSFMRWKQKFPYEKLELYINFFLYYGRITARKKKTKQTGNYAFRTLIVLVSMAIKWDRKHMKGVEFKQCLLKCFTKSNTFILSLMTSALRHSWFALGFAFRSLSFKKDFNFSFRIQ